jgi:CTP:molybdopterin cytidylyltransferase MocA
MTSLTGIVLAAGAGSRMGAPKALMHTPDGVPWVDVACGLLRDAGCDRVLVVLGAAMVPVPAFAEVVVADDWTFGMSASLRAGLLASTGDASLVTLVDLPELPLDVVLRVVAPPIEPGALRQAVFEGRPGHPVLIGREHRDAVVATLTGDRGARSYLVLHGATEVECGDLFDGHDVDR